KTASCIFQTDYTAQAEIGLAGDNRLRFRVSGDGAAFDDALIIDPGTAHIGVGGAPKAQFFIKGSNASDAEQGDIHVEKDGYYGLFVMDTYASFSVAASSFSIQRRARGQASAPEPVQENDWCGGFSFRAYNANAGWTQAALVSAAVDAAPSGSATPMSLIFWTGTTSVSERMRIASDGKVGIGTNAPTTALDVDGPIRCKSYSVAGLPSASQSGAGAMAFVSNAAGGATLAFSDGAAWRRATDRAIVS
ncbi:MAG: hypothetical protein AAGJ87_17315, partial [Pseudomonadota bacterium]